MEDLKQYFKHILKYYHLSDKQTLEENVNNLFTELEQALQLQQTGVMARFNISEDELIKELEDKRICKLSDLPEDIYYLYRKETARWLLEKYDIFKK